MKVTVNLSVLFCYILGIESLIIPDELPSLLSVIYSNIPTLKKGTDSRLGWGFRLGDRADFQVMLELGPQTYTRPLANQGDKGTEKRQTLDTLANMLYAQNEDIKKLKLQQQKEETEDKKEMKKSITNTAKPNIDASEWLKNWSSSVKHQENLVIPPNPKQGLGIGEIDAKSVLPDDDHVNENEKAKVEVSENISVSTTKPTRSTSKEEALDNVDLD